MSVEQNMLLAQGTATNAEDIDFPNHGQLHLAWEDIKDGLAGWRIWLLLAYQDVKLRYRRSVLGPFWITLSMAITVYSMGFLYGHLFHIELEKYYPFLVASMLGWTLISTIILELTEVFTTADSYIKQIKLPYTLYIHRLVMKNIIVFFHNIIVIIPILAIYHNHAKINAYSLLLIPGLAIFYLNGLAYGLILAMIGARYRDVVQIIKSLVQIIFFITPIMWAPEILGVKWQFIVDFNPFYAFIELIRAPLLGHLPTLKNFFMVIFISSIGCGMSLYMFTRYRSRIVYWL